MDNPRQVQNQDSTMMKFMATVKPGPRRRMIGLVREHRVAIDISKEHGGDASAPSPPEYLFLALGGCLVNISRIMAEEKGLELKDMEVTISGEADAARAMGLETDQRAGFNELSVKIRLDGNMSGQEKKSFVKELWTRCPVCDTIENMTGIKLELE